MEFSMEFPMRYTIGYAMGIVISPRIRGIVHGVNHAEFIGIRHGTYDGNHIRPMELFIGYTMAQWNKP